MFFIFFLFFINKSLQNLFGNKPAGFGTTTTSAPSFGTGTGLFGNKPTLTLGTNTNTFGKRDNLFVVCL